MSTPDNPYGSTGQPKAPTIPRTPALPMVATRLDSKTTARNLAKVVLGQSTAKQHPASRDTVNKILVSQVHNQRALGTPVTRVQKILLAHMVPGDIPVHRRMAVLKFRKEIR